MNKFFALPMVGVLVWISTATASGQGTTVYDNQTFLFSTLAGLLPGSADGTGSAARFNSPNGIALDSVGNAYVSDQLNHTIRKMTPAGVVTTFAGTVGVTGNADGIGSAAQFSYPAAVAVDSAGNVYVADNNAIRKITSGGTVTTLAGSPGESGYVDGTGAIARFKGIEGLAVDSAGTVYVSDGSNSIIRKVTPGGVVTTWVGSHGVAGHADATGTAASFSIPGGLAVDSHGNVYVGDGGNNNIRMITPNGVVTTLAGTAGVAGYADGTGTAAAFDGPWAISVDGNGAVFVADSYNNVIRKITPSGVVTTLAGYFTGHADGTGPAASFDGPSGIAVDSSDNLYVADRGNNGFFRERCGWVAPNRPGVG